MIFAIINDSGYIDKMKNIFTLILIVLYKKKEYDIWNSLLALTFLIVFFFRF